MGPQWMLQLKDQHSFQILTKCAEHGKRKGEASLPLPCATSISVAFTRGRDARGPENEGWRATFHFRLQRRARAKRDAISYLAGTDDLYMYKVTITILKTVLAGDKQLLTFLH